MTITTDSEQMIARNTRQAVSIQIEMLTATENALLARIDRSPEEYETLAAAFQVSRIQSDALKNWLADEEDGHHDIVQRVEDMTMDAMKKHGFVVEIKRDEESSGFVTLYWENGDFRESGFIGWKPDASFEEHRENLANYHWICSSWMVLPKDVAEHVATYITPSEWRSRLIAGEKAYTDQVKIWIQY